MGDKRLLQFGLLCSTFTNFCLSIAPTSSIFLSFITALCFGSGTATILKNAVIKHAPPNKVGKVLGATVYISNLMGTLSTSRVKIWLDAKYYCHKISTFQNYSIANLKILEL